jgi:hypothetical protein
MKPITLPTSKMAAYLGISKDFLLNNKGKLFIEGIHYTKPIGLNKIMWIVSKMEEWMLNKSIPDEYSKILQRI